MLLNVFPEVVWIWMYKLLDRGTREVTSSEQETNSSRLSIRKFKMVWKVKLKRGKISEPRLNEPGLPKTRALLPCKDNHLMPCNRI